MFKRHSALTEVLKTDRAARQTERLRIGESPDFSLVQVSAFPDTLPSLEKSLDQVAGIHVPSQVGMTVSHREGRVFKVGPERFWIVSHDAQLDSRVQDAVPEEVGSLLSLSNGFTRVFLEGEGSREVLATGIAIDLHTNIFPAEAFALTELHHTSVLLHRVSVARYELYVPSTFALWIWDWLTDAIVPSEFRDSIQN